MTAKFRSMLQGVAARACIALVCGLLLGAVNHLTYVDPLAATYERFAADTGASFSEMTDEEGADYGNGSVVYYARSDDGGIDAFLVSGGGGFGGNVQIYLYIKDAVIDKLVIGENGETYLDKLEKADFYARFVGQDVTSFDPLSVDAVASATRSSTAVKNGVNAAVRYYNEKIAGGENHG